MAGLLVYEGFPGPYYFRWAEPKGIMGKEDTHSS